ncbi:MAG TPA: LysR substrate-binding domain-containing protein [Gemmataceae bacterium]|nr:LysR substrate-binding domain-containing protein [Gemmataceae bacterium]
MTPDQLPYLETFAKAAELSSFTAAARSMSLTQAAVSQRIQALEQALKRPLFQRQGGHVLLTEAGHRLYDFAMRILALHREAIEEITGKPAALSGEFVLAASSVPGEHLLPDLLVAFQERYPHVQVRASIADSQLVMQQVEHGQVHLGLVGGKKDSPHLEFRSLGRDELALVVASKHPLAHRKRIPLAKLSEVPLILREAGSGSRWCLEQALAAVGKSLRDLRISLELGSNEAIKEALQRGSAAAVLSVRTVRKEIDAGELCPIQVTGLTLARELFVTWDRRRVLPIPARRFLDMLEAPAK